MTTALQGLANVAYAREDVTTARILYEECLALQRKLDHAPGVAQCLNTLGQMAHGAGDDTRASVWLREAEQTYRRLGDAHGLAKTLGNQGDALRAAGCDAEAATVYQESLGIYHRIGERLSYLEALLEIASVHPHHTLAAQLLGATQALCEAQGVPLSDEERTACQRRERMALGALREREYARQIEAGQRLTLEDTLVLALQSSPHPAHYAIMASDPRDYGSQRIH
ncbi:MAG: tetratricopeptide repeat protein [Ktedonobacterales bacterium]